MAVRRWATVFETAAIYVGAVVGAGFASGREIYIFFVRHGSAGPLAAAAAGLMLGLAAACFLPAATRAGAEDYATMCDYVAGRWGGVAAALLSVFLFAGLSVMLAAGATVIALHTSVTYSASVVAMAAITTGFVVFGSRGIAAVNNWLVPYLIVAVLLVAGATLAGSPAGAGRPDALTVNLLIGAPALSLLLYVGYNFVTGVAVLLSLPPACPRQRANGALLGGVALGAMLGLAAAALATQASEIAHLPLPLLDLARALGPAASVLYVPAIGAAILTTAVADAYALARRFSPERPWLAGLGAIVLAMPLANQGFVTLVDNGYPLLGLAGLMFLGLAIWRITRPKGCRR